MLPAAPAAAKDQPAVSSGSPAMESTNLGSCVNIVSVQGCLRNFRVNTTRALLPAAIGSLAVSGEPVQEDEQDDDTFRMLPRNAQGRVNMSFCHTVDQK